MPKQAEVFQLREPYGRPLPSSPHREKSRPKNAGGLPFEARLLQLVSPLLLKRVGEYPAWSGKNVVNLFEIPLPSDRSRLS